VSANDFQAIAFSLASIAFVMPKLSSREPIISAFAAVKKTKVKSCTRFVGRHGRRFGRSVTSPGAQRAIVPGWRDNGERCKVTEQKAWRHPRRE
jgi:hypothetical protein